MLEEPAFPGSPASLTLPPPPTAPVEILTCRTWSVPHCRVTSQVTPSRRHQTAEVLTQRLQKYRVFLAGSKHLRPELLAHGTPSIYSRKGQPCCKPSCPPLGMKHPWLKVWQQEPGADESYSCCQVLGMLFLPHSLPLLESFILNSFYILFQKYDFSGFGRGSRSVVGLLVCGFSCLRLGFSFKLTYLSGF